MDLLERARALAACPLLARLAPAVVVRLAERAEPVNLAAGARRNTADRVWIVVDGALALAVRVVAPPGDGGVPAASAATATAGGVLGLVRVVAPRAAVLELTATAPSTIVGLAPDDVRDVLEEDPAALAALSDALAHLLVDGPR